MALVQKGYGFALVWFNLFDIYIRSFILLGGRNNFVF